MLKKSKFISRSANWLLVLLLGLVFIQGYFIWKDYARPWLSLIRHYGLVSGFQRGEIVYIGFNEAKYVRFLDAYIPKDSPVLLPDASNASFTNLSIMQFYLFPRPIRLCGDQASNQCLEEASDPNSFILAIRDFPSKQLVHGKVFIPFPESFNKLYGVYAPEELANQLPVPSPAVYDRLQPIPLSAPFIEIGVILAFFLLGFVYVSLLLSHPGWLDIFGLSFPLALGFLSWLTFITSYYNIPITLVTVALWYMLLLLIGISLHRILRHSLPAFPLHDSTQSVRDVWRKDRSALVLGAALIIWLGLSVLLSIGQAYSTFDGITNWYLKGYAMAAQHSIWAGDLWGGHVLAYPLNLQLSMATFQLVDGDQLPGSKIIFPILAFSLLLGCYRFLRQHHVSRKAALVGVLSIFTVPLFFVHSTISFANLPLTAYLVLGILWSFDGLLNNQRSWMLLGGVLLAFAAWTRPEGIGFSLIMLAGLYCLAALGMRKKIRWSDLAASLLPILIFPVTWLILLGARELRRDQVGNALGNFLAGAVHGKILWDSINQLISFGLRYFSTWHSAGFLVPASLVVLGLGWLFHHRTNMRLSLFMLILSCLAGIIPAGMFFINSYSGPGFEGFLTQSFDRAYLPAIVLLAISAFMIFDSSPTPAAQFEKGQTP